MARMQTIRVLAALTVFLFASMSYAMDLRFSYVPNEGEAQMCVHERIRDLPDWKVVCGERIYTAHVIVRRAERSQEPQMMLEILYWITEPGPTPTSPNKFHSTTTFLYLKEKTEVFGLVMYLGVENDMASLRLQVSNTPATSSL